jgi:hypothetical protein
MFSPRHLAATTAMRASRPPDFDLSTLLLFQLAVLQSIPRR